MGHRDPELVGRKQELELARGLFDEARTPVLVFVGDPGIGKSAVMNAALQRAREDGIRVLAARPAEAEAQMSFAALTDVLEPVHDAIGVLSEVQRRVLRVALAVEEPGPRPPDIRLVGTAVLALLRRLADEQPTLVAVDDAQWVDPSSAMALSFALRRIGEGRLRALMARRAPDGRGLLVDVADVHSLAPLETDHVGAIVGRTVGRALPRPLLRRVAEAAGGNALYALEIARTVVADSGSRSLSDPLPVPEDVRELVASRIAGLPANEQRVVLRLAASSRSLADRFSAEVEAPNAMRAGILRADGRGFRFTHPLYAEAVYAESTAAERRRVHAEIARLADDPEERGRHLARTAEGPDAAVAAALDDAAASARARGALDAAAALASDAVDATPASSPHEIARRLQYATRLLFELEAFDRARELASRAIAEASSAVERARAMRELALIVGETDGVQAAVDIYRRALAEPFDDDDVLRGLLEQSLAWNMRIAMDLHGARPHAARAVALAERTGDPTLTAAALATLYEIEVVAGVGPPRTMIERALEAETRANELFFDESPTHIYVRSLMVQEQFDAARAVLENLRTRVEATGEVALLSVWYSIAEVEHRSGSWRRALELATAGLELADQVGRSQAVNQFRNTRLWALAHLGDVAAVRAEAETTSADRWRAQMDLAALAAAELSVGRFAEAADAAAASLQLLREGGFKRLSQLPFVYAEALIGCGRVDDAESVLAAAVPQPHAPPSAIVASLRVRAMLAAARRDVPAALALLDEALAYEAQIGRPFERARILLVAGGIHRRARQKREASEALEAALAIFEEMGAGRWADGTREELARIGGRPSRQGSLTETERRIADLVAGGRTNHEVAHALHVSPKTVEWNLSKVYRKLHVASRTELAAKFARRAADPGNPRG